ncbi:PREDICTED: muscle M-line assembly protein unc-89 [Nelumbo nucifera]|uniref:Muscle M-line assembly protein unc-89 n=1 Tax=Nelumbo nucifera TaxID=4432 RepID=A0A1U7YM00_NELNU|nr:PREDICTED: muscle M-line assembly protein unc-89 [Nelumbo nucifera]
MASETVVSDHCTDERIEKKVNEAAGTVEEGVSPPKENEITNKEEKLKVAELITPESPLTESEEKMENKPIEPSVAVEVQKVERVVEAPGSDVPVEDISKVVSSPDLKQDVSSTLEPAVDAGKESEDSSNIPDFPVEDSSKLIASPDLKPDTSSTPEPAVQVVEEKSETYSVVRNKPSTEADKPHEQLEVSAIIEPQLDIGKEPENVTVLNPKITEKPVSIPEVEEKPQEPLSIEAVDKPVEQLEARMVNESEAEVEKEPDEVSVLESKLVEEAQLVRDVEVTDVINDDEKEPETLKHEQSVDSEITKDVETLADKVDKVKEGTEFLKSEPTTKDQEPIVSESPGEVISICQEEEANSKEDEGGSVLPDAVGNVNVEDRNKEGGIDAIEGLSKEAIVEVKKLEEEKEEENVKVEGNEEKNLKIEEAPLLEPTKSKDACSSDSSPQVSEKSFQGEKTPLNVEVVTDDKKAEDSKDDSLVLEGVGVIAASTVSDPVGEPKELESQKRIEEAAQSIEEKMEKTAEVIEDMSKSDDPKSELSKNGNDPKADADPPKPEKVTVSDPVGESKDLESQTSVEATAQSAEEKMEKTAEVIEDISKSDAPKSELSKSGNDPKADADPPKPEIQIKSTPKQSNNIISKVKHSFVKVKKAIIGKSPSSKTISSEVKGDVQVK